MIPNLERIKKEFAHLKTSEEIYHKIMEWGKKLAPFDPAWKTEERRVEGCQSLMYLHAEVRGERLHFSADSDALISRGLAALLIFLYSGEKAETILKTPPACFDDLGIVASLTPGRANGFAGLYLRMKQEALKALLLSKRENQTKLA